MSNRLKKTSQRLAAVLIAVACGFAFSGCSLFGMINSALNPESVGTVIRTAHYNDSEDADRLTEALYDGLYAYDRQIDLSEFGLTAGNGGEAAMHRQLQYLLNNRAELFHVMPKYSFSSDSSGIIVALSPSYSITGTALEAARVEFSELVGEIVATADADLTPLETLLYYHDYLVLNYEYDDTLESNTAYSILKSGAGVCRAYTLLYAELLRNAGIETSSVVNDGMEHIWNGVRLDGQWYHIDVTQDDPVGALPGNISHEYFLCSDTTLADHGTPAEWERTFVCNSGKYDGGNAKRITSPVVRLDGRLYAVSGKSVVELDEHFEAVKTIYTFKSDWQGFGSSGIYYPNTVFSGLISYEGRLLLNTQKEILSLDPVSKDAQTVYTYKGGDGYIYGLYLSGGDITAVIAKSAETGDLVKTVTLKPAE